MSAWRFECLIVAALVTIAFPIGFIGFEDAPSIGNGTSETVFTAYSDDLATYNQPYIFPAQSYADIRNSTNLSTLIFDSLGYGEGDGPFENTSTIFDMYFRISETNEYFGVVEGVQSRSYLSGGEVNLTQYYGDEGQFIGIDIRLPDSTMYAYSESDYVNQSRMVAEALGIPGDMLVLENHWTESDFTNSQGIESVQDYVTDDGIQGIWNNYSIVLLSSDYVDGIPLDSCNLIATEFNDDTHALVRIKSWMFVETPIERNLTQEDALTIGGDYAPTLFYDPPQDILIREDITALKLSLRTMTFAYEYTAIVEIRDDSSMSVYRITILIDCEDGTILFSDRTFPAVEQTHRVLLENWQIAALAIISATGLTIIFIELSPDFALAVISLLYVPLYMRLKGVDVLNNFNRGRIMGYITGRPGSSSSQMKRDLSLSNGTLAYHLLILERLEMIRSDRDGKYRRYFPIGVTVHVSPEKLLGRTEALAFQKIADDGPMTNADLASTLGISRQRSHYNLRLLQSKGLVGFDGLKWHANNPVNQNSVSAG